MCALHGQHISEIAGRFVARIFLAKAVQNLDRLEKCRAGISELKSVLQQDTAGEGVLGSFGPGVRKDQHAQDQGSAGLRLLMFIALVGCQGGAEDERCDQECG